MRQLIIPAALALLLGAGAGAPANEKRAGPDFGTLEPTPAAAARAQVQGWLKDAGKADPATAGKLDAIWAQEDRTVVDRIADSVALGSPAAAKLLADARDPVAPAPTKIDPFFKDANVPAFVRANLALGYARTLANRHVYDEALETLKLFTSEQVADPAAYLFHRAAGEHALLQKAEATRTIRRLLNEARDASPERYKSVAMLMLLDMETWKDKDLGSIARKMKVIEDRLDLARGGPKTQKLQKEVVMRLDEMIKELENKAKKPGGS